MKFLYINLLFILLMGGGSSRCTHDKDFEIIAEKMGRDISEGGANASKMEGTWARNDGQAQAWLKITGSTAYACVGSTKTTGTFNASAPSITFVNGGITYVFPLQMQGDKLIMMVPSQGNANHIPTEYVKSNVWPCN